MVLQRCILPILKTSARLRYSPLCAFQSFRRVATKSDPNTVSALFATSLASPSILISHMLANAAPETNTTL